ncbi:hypothetical protein RI129_010450 [Pyrocoelia pectoralis]|uniref:Cytochrome P450 n=1 Tax=Pyrocoelia pectoralis TaxID=417401 RepID=A0AAN7ZJY8_9COLE
MIYLLLLLIFVCAIWRFTTWNRRGIRQYNFWTIWWKNFNDVIRQLSYCERSISLCRDFPNERYVGTYQSGIPTLCVKDPKLIQKILTKDFDHFRNRYPRLPDDGDPVLRKSLFLLNGTPWKTLRKVASPIFTLKKLKIMYAAMMECSINHCKILEHQVAPDAVLEMKSILAHLATDIFCLTHFSIYVNSLSDPNNKLYNMIKSIFDLDIRFYLRVGLIKIFPPIARFLGLRVFNQEMILYFQKLVDENRKARVENNLERPDIIDLLYIQNKDNENLTVEDTTATIVSFFAAGFDTVSSLMGFITFELAKNPQKQQKLQTEIDETFKACNGNVPYETMLKLKFLDCVISETLRLWSATAFMERECVKPYTIPAEVQGEKPIHLKVGDVVAIPTFGLHRDPKFYEEPDSFKPERFLTCDEFFMPFGNGPRQCIGNRYSMVVTKVAMFNLFLKFNILPSEKTAKEIRVLRTNLQVVSKDGYWLKLQRRG